MRFRNHPSNQWANGINGWILWLAASNAPPGTRRVRRNQLRHFAERYLHRSPWQLGNEDIVTYLTTQRWAPETLRGATAAIRSFYRWAYATGKTSHNPAEALPSVHVPTALPRPVPEAVLTEALNRADDRTRLMILLASFAGMRAGEISHIKLKDIHDEHIIVHGKGGNMRLVPLHEKLQPELRAELARRRAGDCGTGYRYKAGLRTWLFPGQHGGSLTAGAVTRVLSRTLNGHTAHQLRHWFGSQTYEHTHDLRAVQELLGHRRIATTVRYTRLELEALAAAVGSLELTLDTRRHVS